MYILRFPNSLSEIWYFSNDQFLYNGRISLGVSFSSHSISGMEKNGEDNALNSPTF